MFLYFLISHTFFQQINNPYELNGIMKNIEYCTALGYGTSTEKPKVTKNVQIANEKNTK